MQEPLRNSELVGSDLKRFFLFRNWEGKNEPVSLLFYGAGLYIYIYISKCYGKLFIAVRSCISKE
jgi:hypothetical protein